MGTRERHERDRASIRRGILDAARDLFVKEGYQHVSLRKIAERIEYSPAAIYGYFSSKDDIFFSLAEEGFRLLGDPWAAEATEALRALPPLERLRTIFRRFYEFSRQHPQYFALMFIDRSVPRISREYERFAFAREIRRHLFNEIQACIDQKVLPDTIDPHVVMRLVMASLLGVAVMQLSDRLGPSENADLLADDAIDLMLAGIRSGAVTVKSKAATLECAVDDEEENLQAS
jgi:AcrR family transcriptional regulator